MEVKTYIDEIIHREVHTQRLLIEKDVQNSEDRFRDLLYKFKEEMLVLAKNVEVVESLQLKLDEWAKTYYKKKQLSTDEWRRQMSVFQEKIANSLVVIAKR